ncbi:MULTISPECIES: endo-1,4-beta-xylanase [unclassified Paenibacillus]|uniref:endo-1,4-beta-xylanase n=1 Tax=unclassified Paenibacillus TaxID=185978 RepID=UPI0024070149|nr:MULTISPECIES: endo-1,4-beta-xylanase [unclassified Paenibacillus]MDF9844309.1 endo-1,4-beta-xylanase [Paenibacillus sp. PastF-2]MDF9850902.1 endo-1,4-beta-xylanase [Paenibacillus sp. PastM-2]MDF9857484.1 endo-1,4-beta-xylanase [Paenibacillus sp. PastF-1]MDH6482740.1 endo-1,4-beta-xylanase [Paenibacillus sp. PastH-2]MDH6510166.1 endo-1,4-beta-xylanase [Paenibacillus sp. PastM-3]
MGDKGFSGPSLKGIFTDDFKIGAAVNPLTIRSQEQLLAYHFNSITAENEMKFESVHPQEEVYTFDHADELAAFARKHGLAMRGHTLVWHNQTSDWLFTDGAGTAVSKELLLSRLKSHIDTVVGRYRGQIYAWDVVNEVIADEGQELLRSSKWLEIAGPEFIARAFEYAHEADPQALLFYNDYNESHPQKRDKIYTLMKSLLDQGVPIHGVGLQAHWNLYDPGLDDIRAAIEKYASLGLQLQLTELDLSLFRFDDKRTDLASPPPELLELQAERYDAVFRLLREYRQVISSVTFWGAADDYTWLDNFPVRGRKNWPFLFDEQHRPKPAFERLAALSG